MDFADALRIAVTSVLNGAFKDMLGNEMPIIQMGLNRVLYWQNAKQPLDFTTKNDVAAYTAKVALDRQTPRILRIAGDSISADGIAQALTAVEGQPFKTQ